MIWLLIIAQHSLLLFQSVLDCLTNLLWIWYFQDMGESRPSGWNKQNLIRNIVLMPLWIINKLKTLRKRRAICMTTTILVKNAKSSETRAVKFFSLLKKGTKTSTTRMQINSMLHKRENFNSNTSSINRINPQGLWCISRWTSIASHICCSNKWEQIHNSYQTCRTPHRIKPCKCTLVSLEWINKFLSKTSFKCSQESTIKVRI